MPDETNDDYEVGYGRPPRHSQFKPGQSGNPKGRPKRSKNAQVLLDRILGMTPVEWNNRSGGTIAEAFIKSLMADALKGKADARRIVMTYMMSQKEVLDFEVDELDQRALDDWLKRANQLGEEATDGSED